MSDKQPHDAVDHPTHYTSHPSGIECIQITEHMGFNLGNALKYIWRADLKGAAIEDLKKAARYVQRELEKRENEKCTADLAAMIETSITAMSSVLGGRHRVTGGAPNTGHLARRQEYVDLLLTRNLDGSMLDSGFNFSNSRPPNLGLTNPAPAEDSEPTWGPWTVFNDGAGNFRFRRHDTAKNYQDHRMPSGALLLHTNEENAHYFAQLLNEVKAGETSD